MFKSRAKPMFLLADSQLLFWREAGQPFMRRMTAALDREPSEAKAAYFGASNGDDPDFYALFESVMADNGVRECMHVRAQPDANALEFVDEADIVLLAGGDVEQGWRAFEDAGLADRIRCAASRGAVLIGVSAGAVQLGTMATAASGEVMSLLSLSPYAISVHGEPDWPTLVSVVARAQGVVGLGIPRGGGAIVHPDCTVEPVRKPITEIVARGDEIRIAELVAAPSTLELSIDN